jgi:hypothetical protein
MARLALTAAPASAAEEEEPEGDPESAPAGYAVWGSSSGWLVFYAAAGLGVRSVGYELLQCHVDTAQSAAAAGGVPADLARFVHGWGLHLSTSQLNLSRFESLRQ